MIEREDDRSGGREHFVFHWGDQLIIDWLIQSHCWQNYCNDFPFTIGKWLIHSFIHWSTSFIACMHACMVSFRFVSCLVSLLFILVRSHSSIFSFISASTTLLNKLPNHLIIFIYILCTVYIITILYNYIYILCYIYTDDREGRIFLWWQERFLYGKVANQFRCGGFHFGQFYFECRRGQGRRWFGLAHW